MSYIDNSGPAFPMIRDMRHNADWDYEPGITVRQWFMAHAPAEPQPWFEPKMPPRPSKPELSSDHWAVVAMEKWQAEKRKQRFVQWPAAWADEQLKAMKA